MRTELKVLILFAILVTLPACRETTVDESAEGLASRGENALASGNDAEALEFFSRALDLDPDAPSRSEWMLGKATAQLRLDRFEEALLSAREAQRSAPDPQTLNRAVLLEAGIEFSRNSYVNSISLLSDLDVEMLDRTSSSAATELARSALQNLDTRTLAGFRQNNWLEVFVLLALEWKYAEQGDFERSTLFGMEIDRLYPSAHDEYGSPLISPDEGTFFALVLPMSGEGSVYSTEIANGVSLAFERFRDLHQASPELVIFDTGERGSDLESIISTLGLNLQCLGVIGPLTSSSTLAIAPCAEEYSLPLISPSATSAEIDGYDQWVHRLVVSQGDQAATVAEYAVRTAGCSRLAIIHPYTAEAVAEAEQFTVIVEEFGAYVVVAEGYQPEATDFKAQIMAVKAYSPDGIFLPVSAWDAVQLAPQLRFYSVELPLFGTSGWDSELLIRLGEEYVEGAVFTVAFGTGSLYPATARFVYNYKRRFDTDPTSIAAQGYDTAELFLQAWEGRTHTRSSIERALQAMRPYYGASGRCTLGTSSVARSSYPLLTIIDGEIVSIE